MSISVILSRNSRSSSPIHSSEASFISAYKNDDPFLLKNNSPLISLKYTSDGKYVIYTEGTESAFFQ